MAAKIKYKLNGEVHEVQGLPDQTGKSGKFLSTDGTDPSWEDVAGTQVDVGPDTPTNPDTILWVDTDDEGSTIDVDGVPTEGSLNAVSSGGVYDALATIRAQASGAVRHDIIQSLSSSEKAQARANIGAINGNVIANKGWNQLSNNKGAVTTTASGVTFTANSDGSIDINGTATANVFFQIPSVNPVNGHKYLVKGGYATYTSTIQVSYRANRTSDIVVNDTRGGGAIAASSIGGSNGKVVIRVENGATLSNFVCKPQLFDLTALFGAGNEPSTVEEFKSMFPNDYYEYYPIGGFISNRNLLDSSWFTVNQRGQSSYQTGGGAYTVDRWKCNNGSAQCTIEPLSGGGIKITNNMSDYFYFNQPLEFSISALGRTTKSAIVDGVFYSGYSDTIACGDNVLFYVGSDTTMNFRVAPNCTVIITACKLEKGSVSTLANDAAPNYAEELLKCQRYCKVFVPAEHLGIGYARTTTRADVVVSTHLRVLPSATMIGNVILNKTDGTSINTTNNTVPEIYGANGSFSLRFYTTGATQSEILRFTINTDSKLILSADL